MEELDSLRGVAALGVLLFHYAGHFKAQPAAWLFGPFYANGGYLVDFFFVLSGVVLADAYADRGLGFPALCRLRAARLLPLHLATLAAVLSLQAILLYGLGRPLFVYDTGWDLRHLAYNLSLVHGFLMDNPLTFNGPSWSISAELWANVLFFAVLGLRSRGPRIAACVALAAAAAAWQLLFSPSVAVWVSIGGALPRAVLGFFAGAALRLAVRWRGVRVGAAWDAAFAAAAVAAVGLMADAGGVLEAAPAVDHALPFLVFPCALVAARRGRRVGALLRTAPMLWLGRASFSIYIVHFPVQLALHTAAAAAGASPDWSSPLALAAFVAAVLACAEAARRWVEAPGGRLARRLLRV
jgi:peptidoglycan/LPS O-acetylase OafA/YrhL